jgi:hypothetical protein
LKEETSEIVAKKYAIGIKKQRSEQKKEISRIYFDILPKQSGRNYRY